MMRGERQTADMTRRLIKHTSHLGNPSIVAAIHLRWWKMIPLSKANEPSHQFGWSAVDCAAKKCAGLLAPLKLYQDSMAPSGASALSTAITKAINHRG